MKHLVKEAGREAEFFIDSAATDNDALGCPIHRGTRTVLIQNKIPFSEHYARLTQIGDLEKFDEIICMDSENVRHLKRIFGSENEKVKKLLSFCGENRDVADPWYTGNFNETFSDVLRGCKALLKTF